MTTGKRYPLNEEGIRQFIQDCTDEKAGDPVVEPRNTEPPPPKYHEKYLSKLKTTK